MNNPLTISLQKKNSKTEEWNEIKLLDILSGVQISKNKVTICSHRNKQAAR